MEIIQGAPRRVSERADAVGGVGAEDLYGTGKGAVPGESIAAVFTA